MFHVIIKCTSSNDVKHYEVWRAVCLRYQWSHHAIILFNIISINFPTINFSGVRVRGERNVFILFFWQDNKGFEKGGGGKLHSTLYKHEREKNITIGFKFSIAIGSMKQFYKHFWKIARFILKLLKIWESGVWKWISIFFTPLDGKNPWIKLKCL